MGDDSKAVETEVLDQVREIVHIVLNLGNPFGFVGVAESPQIGCDDIEMLGKRRDVLAPSAPELGPSVLQDDRHSLPVPDVMYPQTRQVRVLVIPREVGHCRKYLLGGLGSRRQGSRW